MAFIVGADPDRLEAAARQFTEASRRLESVSRQLNGLLAQARDNRSPATAYAEMATLMPTLANHVVEAKTAVKLLTDRAILQRRKSGAQDERGSTGSGSSGLKPQFTAEEQRLIERVEGDLEYLARKAEQQRRAGEGNFWFTKTYEHVTRELLKSVKNGGYANPKAVLLEEIGFTQVYRQNLAAWESGNYNAVYPNWTVAFERIQAINDGTWQLKSHERASMVIPAAKAHILWDLPDVIADVARRTYGNDITDREIEIVRNDFNKMAGIFPTAEKAMRQEILNGTVRFDLGRSQTLQDLMRGAFLPTDELRWQAFNTAEQIINAHRAGIHDSEGIQRYLYDKGVLPRRISTQTVDNYPWR